MYPSITYEKGEVDDYTAITPASYLFGFVTGLLKVNWNKHFDDLPDDDTFLVNEYANIQTGENITELVEIGDTEKLFVEYDWLEEAPEAEGWRYSFKVSEVASKYQFGDITKVLDDDGFIYKMEYEAARKYLDELVAKHQSKDDFFAGLF